MIGFLYQLASTAAHVIAYAGRRVAEETGIITDRSEWAIVHLMGQKKLYGRVIRHDSHVEVLAFNAEQNDILVPSFHGWQAVYQVEIRGEDHVRRSYVESAANGSWKACANWNPSSVAPYLCRACAFERGAHDIAKAESARVQRFADMIRETIGCNGAVVHMRGEDGDTYDGRNGPIEYVSVVVEGIARQLTADEWEKARQAGVRLGPYGSQDPYDPEDPYAGSDDDIPF